METDSFQRFVILLTVDPSVETTPALIRAHVKFLRDLDAAGKMVLCGPFTDYRGGMVIIKAENRSAADEIAKSDPFVRSGARSYELRTWQLSNEENNHLGRG